MKTNKRIKVFSFDRTPKVEEKVNTFLKELEMDGMISDGDPKIHVTNSFIAIEYPSAKE